MMGFDEVGVYGPDGVAAPRLAVRSESDGGGIDGVDGDVDLAIVTYGNGVVTALQAQRELEELARASGGAAERKNVVIVDCPLLSDVPAELPQALRGARSVLFADICKEGAAPLTTHVAKLQAMGALPASWLALTAPKTYNPLGNVTTFLNVDDVTAGARALLARGAPKCSLCGEEGHNKRTCPQ
jgi:hypothetical protein